MKAIALFARTTIVGGVFFLAPIVVLIVILAKAFGFAKTGLQAVVASHSRDFGLERRRGDGAFDRDDRARLPSCWARRPYPDRPTLRQRIGVVGAVEDSGLRISETGERKRLGRRRDWGASRCVRAHGRGMAARRSNRSVEQRPRLDLRPRRAEPALRVGLFLFDGHRSARGHQARRGLGCLRRCGAGASALGASWPSGNVRG